jgi:hypothetical protein
MVHAYTVAPQDPAAAELGTDVHAHRSAVGGAGMTQEELDDGFGLAQIKLEGEDIKYDPNAPIGPPETWRDRMKWRIRALRFYFRRLGDAILNRETGW